MSSVAARVYLIPAPAANAQPWGLLLNEFIVVGILVVAPLGQRGVHVIHHFKDLADAGVSWKQEGMILIRFTGIQWDDYGIYIYIGMIMRYSLL